MGWAARHIEKLLMGETVEFRPRGNSMSGIINDNDLVVVEPITESTKIAKGDVVLCRVNGNEYLHLVKSVGDDGRYMIGNNKGGTNGWTKQIFGKFTCVKHEC